MQINIAIDLPAHTGKQVLERVAEQMEKLLEYQLLTQGITEGMVYVETSTD